MFSHHAPSISRYSSYSHALSTFMILILIVIMICCLTPVYNPLSFSTKCPFIRKDTSTMFCCLLLSKSNTELMNFNIEKILAAVQKSFNFLMDSKIVLNLLVFIIRLYTDILFYMYIL